MLEEKFKIAWVHNYSPDNVNSGNFMKLAHNDFDEAEDLKVDLYYLNTSAKNILKNIQKFFSIRRDLLKYDIIHVQYGSLIFALTCFALMFSKKTIMVTLRGSDFNRLPLKLSREFIHSFIATGLTRLFLYKAANIICVSERMARSLNVNNKIVLPSPINPKFFQNLNGPRKKTNKVTFAAVEPLSVNKRLWLAKESIEYVKRYEDVDFQVITNTNPSAMVNILDQTDVVLLTSKNEGWPNIIKEGLARGKPFVATDVGDLKEIVSEQENLGSVCIDDPSIICKELLRQLSAAEIYADERVRYSSIFKTQHHTKKLTEIYLKNLAP